ncbi:junctional adhesion molecule A, partial [Pelodytes ibericus]
FTVTAALGGVSTPNPQISAKEGDSVEMGCTYTADFQNPRVEWKFVNNEQETSLIYYDSKLTASYKDRAVFYPNGLRLSGLTRNDNGEYICEVTGRDPSGSAPYGDARTKLTVLVPPSKPIAQVPTSVTNGGVATLTCIEKDSSPPATFTWYKDKIQMPSKPEGSPNFQNSSYILNPSTGMLKFDPVKKTDSGEYYCEARNTQGVETSAVVWMEATDVNVGGIVAAVIVCLLLVALIAFGVWFAYSRGFFNKKTNKKVIYSQPSETRSDRNFQQTSSFLV